MEDEDEAERETPDSKWSFTDQFLAKLLSVSEAKDKAVRLRVCQMVGKILTYIIEMQRAVDTELLGNIQEVMLERVFDKVRKVE